MCIDIQGHFPMPYCPPWLCAHAPVFDCLLPPSRCLQLSVSDAEYEFARTVLAEFPSSQMEENHAVNSHSRILTAL